MSKNHVLHSFLEMLLFLFCPFLVFAVPPPPVSGARRTRPAGGAVAGGPQHAAHRRGRQGLSTERGGRREEQQPRDGWTTGKKLHLRSRGEGGECFQVGEPGAEGELGVFFFSIYFMQSADIFGMYVVCSWVFEVFLSLLFISYFRDSGDMRDIAT